MKTLIKVMKAFADPGRVKIIKMLGMREMCVCEIQAALGLAQPTISKHLKILEEAGLVESSKERMWVNYRLSGHGGSVYGAVMLDHMRDWLQDEPEIKQLINELPNINREQICNR